MAPLAPLVPPAMEEDAKTTSATKVCVFAHVCERKRNRERQREHVQQTNMVTLLEDDGSYTQEETEENNFIEPEAPRTPQKPRPRAPKPEKFEPPSLPTPAPTKPPTEEKNEVVNTQQMCKLPFNCLFCI